MDSDEQEKLLAHGGDSVTRKPRKAYTISKQRENWSDEEHQKFLEALKLFDRDWKKIEKFIGTKSVIQIRSHAQKYFLKVTKNNTGERIPPPRPKRKSAPTPKQKSESIPANPFINNPTAFAHWMAQNGLLPGNLSPNTDFNASQAIELHRQQHQQLQQAQHYLQQAMASTRSSQQSSTPQGPNFGKIYSFLGNLFDPSITNHSEVFEELSPVDKETIQLLMHNLSLNLSIQQFREQHTYLLDQYKSIVKGQPLFASHQGADHEKDISTPPLINNMNPLLNTNFQKSLSPLIHESHDNGLGS